MPVKHTIEILRDLIKKEGHGVIHTPQRFEALVKDLLWEDPLEANLLIVSLKAGIPEKLLKASVPANADLFLQSQAKLLEDSYAINSEQSQNAVYIWVQAIGIGGKQVKVSLPTFRNNVVIDKPIPSASSLTAKTTERANKVSRPSIRPVARREEPDWVLPVAIVYVLIPIILISSAYWFFWLRTPDKISGSEKLVGTPINKVSSKPVIKPEQTEKRISHGDASSDRLLSELEDLVEGHGNTLNVDKIVQVVASLEGSVAEKRLYAIQERAAEKLTQQASKRFSAGELEEALFLCTDARRIISSYSAAISLQRIIKESTMAKRAETERLLEEARRAVEKNKVEPAEINNPVSGTLFVACDREWQIGESNATVEDARSWVSSLGKDWRLPTLEELKALYEKVGVNSPIGKFAVFSAASDENSVWLFYFNGGYEVSLPNNFRAPAQLAVVVRHIEKIPAPVEVQKTLPAKQAKNEIDYVKPEEDNYKQSPGGVFNACGKNWHLGSGNVSWSETQVKIRNLADGWKTPSRKELQELYGAIGANHEIMGKNMVWADFKDASSAWCFDFSSGREDSKSSDFRNSRLRALAVRPVKKTGVKVSTATQRAAARNVFSACGKEWQVGHTTVTWNETTGWVNGLGNGWRQPYSEELLELHAAIGSRSMFGDNFVWAEAKDSSFAYYVKFGGGSVHYIGCDHRGARFQALAVRP